MNNCYGRRALALLAICTLSLSLVGAAAAPGGAEAPHELVNEQWQSGMIRGSRAGAFAYYAIRYPGDDRVVTIELRHWPGDAVTNNAVGFNVYASNGYFIGHGERLKNIEPAGVVKLQYSDSNRDTWLVQVYNYLDGYDVSFGIGASGLPPLPPPPPAPALPPTGSQLLGVSYLTGNSAGIFQYFNVTVAAGGPDVQITLLFWPDDALIPDGVGIMAYGPNGWTGRADRTGNAGERKITLSANRPGVYRLQLYHYVHGVTIRYTLSSAAAAH